MEVVKNDDTFLIPLEDIETLICSGAGIRMSTMAMSQIATGGISMMVINEKYHPSCISLPFESNVRQSLVLREQIALTKEEKYNIWADVIKRKVENQARALTLLGSEGSEAILKYTSGFDAETIDLFEAKAAKALAAVLYHACSIDGAKMSVSNGIGEMVASIRRIIVYKDDTKIKLPLLLPVEVLDPVNE